VHEGFSLSSGERACLACCRHLAGGREAITQERNYTGRTASRPCLCQRDAGSTLNTYGEEGRGEGDLLCRLHSYGQAGNVITSFQGERADGVVGRNKQRDGDALSALKF
jgi:hypothetical protein